MSEHHEGSEKTRKMMLFEEAIEPAGLLPSKRVFAEGPDQPVCASVRPRVHRGFANTSTPAQKYSTLSIFPGPTRDVAANLASMRNHGMEVEPDLFVSNVKDASCQTTQAETSNFYCQTLQTAREDFGCQCDIVISDVHSANYEVQVSDTRIGFQNNCSGKKSEIIQAECACNTCPLDQRRIGLCKNDISEDSNHLKNALHNHSLLHGVVSESRIQNDSESVIAAAKSELSDACLDQSEQSDAYSPKSSRAGNINFLLNGIDTMDRAIFLNNCESPKKSCLHIAPINELECTQENLKFSTEMFEIGINHIASEMASRIFRRISSSMTLDQPINNSQTPSSKTVISESVSPS